MDQYLTKFKVAEMSVDHRTFKPGICLVKVGNLNLVLHGGKDLALLGAVVRAKGADLGTAWPVTVGTNVTPIDLFEPGNKTMTSRRLVISGLNSDKGRPKGGTGVFELYTCFIQSKQDGNAV